MDRLKKCKLTVYFPIFYMVLPRILTKQTSNSHQDPYSDPLKTHPQTTEKLPGAVSSGHLLGQMRSYLIIFEPHLFFKCGSYIFSLFFKHFSQKSHNFVLILDSICEYKLDF